MAEAMRETLRQFRGISSGGTARLSAISRSSQLLKQEDAATVRDRRGPSWHRASCSWLPAANHPSNSSPTAEWGPLRRRSSLAHRPTRPLDALAPVRAGDHVRALGLGVAFASLPPPATGRVAIADSNFPGTGPLPGLCSDLNPAILRPGHAVSDRVRPRGNGRLTSATQDRSRQGAGSDREAPDPPADAARQESDQAAEARDIPRRIACEWRSCGSTTTSTSRGGWS
jgi:hypothetical protein